MADFNYTGGVRFAPDKVVDVTADKEGNPTKACNPITGVCLEGGGIKAVTVKVHVTNPEEYDEGDAAYTIPSAVVIDGDEGEPQTIGDAGTNYPLETALVEVPAIYADIPSTLYFERVANFSNPIDVEIMTDWGDIIMITGENPEITVTLVSK